jgi:hypothetical protein
MTRRRRIIVAFQQVEDNHRRWLREAASGEPATLDELRHPPGLGRYWCAADKPDAGGDDFRLAPVYRTHKVPADATCEECAISIRELQELMA